MARKSTLIVQTLDGSTFFVAKRAITPQPTTFVITERPKGETQITAAQERAIRKAVKTTTTRTGTPKLRIGEPVDSDLAAAKAEITRLRAEMARIKQ